MNDEVDTVGRGFLGFAFVPGVLGDWLGNVQHGREHTREGRGVFGKSIAIAGIYGYRVRGSASSEAFA